MEKRIICIVLILATMATLLVGCGSSKELPPPAKPANEAEAEALIAQSSADEHKIFPDLTVDELCELSLNEMRQLEFRGILDTLTEAEQEQYLKAIKAKQADRDKTRGAHSEEYALLDKNMLWPLNDSIESWTFVDCITGKIYSFPVIGLDEIIDSINMERFVPDVYGKGSDIPSGRAGCPSPITDELWYDPWTKSEYKYPIDIYLARLEMGALSVLFNQGRLQPLGSYEKYSARPIEEVSNVQKTEDELYGPHKSPFTDDSDYARYYTQYYAIKKMVRQLPW